MKLLFLLLFLSTLTQALEPHTATYSLSVAGFKIADERRVLSQKNNIYYYSAHAKTSGPMSLFKDYEIDAKSSFIIDEFGLKSKHYQYFERDGKTIKKDINIRPENQQIDPLSLFLALSQALEKNPAQTDFYFLVNDGEEIKRHHYQQAKSEDKNLIKIIRPGKQLEAYFAKDKNYFPVLIKSKKITLQLQQNQTKN
ncbi:MAG: DUF3108 domain-containing protein [Candidatus Thioglobus sp.]|nr:DUF3108 domain-containing protein [Candidatus Thioglobus sp.]